MRLIASRRVTTQRHRLQKTDDAATDKPGSSEAKPDATKDESAPAKPDDAKVEKKPESDKPKADNKPENSSDDSAKKQP